MSSSSSSSTLRRHYSLDEIKNATNNFDANKVLGKGGQGIVYLAKVILDNKMTQVAVKHILRPADQDFGREIMAMSYIHHPNLVSPLGYCLEADQKILVHEYMEKGSLRKYTRKKISVSLSWVQRIRICLDAARGLQRLHMETDEFPKGIIHRSVKPSNILLDKDWVAKISESGFAKFSHAGQVQSIMTTKLRGTGGYYAPEYVRYGSITRKIDVYAFGVVLFEVLCLKSPWDAREDESYFQTEDDDLGIWAQQNVDKDIIAEISDVSLTEYTAIIGATLKMDPEKRPTMNGVVSKLEKVLILQESGYIYEGKKRDLTSVMEKVLKIKLTEAEAEAEKRSAAARDWDEDSPARYRRRAKSTYVSLDVVKLATNNFDDKTNFLGKGGEAKVYLANIKMGLMLTQVAVKRLNPFSAEFDTEITTMSEIKHDNILSLLGYSDQFGEKILIYEYMEKGSLAKYVRKREESSSPLPWVQRLRICLDAARGLQHLHVETEKNPKGIVHRDIKPGNILLGKDWVAKISDFGMFKASEVGQVESMMETALKGTIGYFPPEYNRLGKVSKKSDVYCFGIVMYQVLCLTMPWDRGDESVIVSDENDFGGYAAQNPDPEIKADICDDSLNAYTAIIGESMKDDPNKRPTMDGVVSRLETALKFQESFEMNK